MRNLIRLLLLIGIIVTTFNSCKVGYGITFNRGYVVFKANEGYIKIYNIPDGYTTEDIRIVRTHTTKLIIPYADSSILYVCYDLYDFPNRENVGKMHTITSEWRNNIELLSTFNGKEIDEALKQKQVSECDCTYSELFEYKIPETIDLSDISGEIIWRDIMIEKLCIGYIVYDSTKIKDFDRCVESTINKIK